MSFPYGSHHRPRKVSHQSRSLWMPNNRHNAKQFLCFNGWPLLFPDRIVDNLTDCRYYQGCFSPWNGFEFPLFGFAICKRNSRMYRTFAPYNSQRSCWWRHSNEIKSRQMTFMHSIQYSQVAVCEKLPLAVLNTDTEYNRKNGETSSGRTAKAKQSKWGQKWKRKQ